MANENVDTHGGIAGPLRIAAIDLGTVSSRLICAVLEDGRIVDSFKRTVITDLGEGVDATGSFAPAAVARVVDACRDFVREAAEFRPEAVCTTLTSAARDVDNASSLLEPLMGLGLDPQIISGELEARLTFFGVAHDFPGRRIAVADSGGGSTELVIGSYVPGRPLQLEAVESLDIGCRRVTERFFRSDPPSREDVEAAGVWVRPQFDRYWASAGALPQALVAVGGTVTSLVAMTHGLEKYDSAFVHLRDLSLAEVEGVLSLMTPLDSDGIAALPGIQPKRAPVIRAGALIIRELMRSGGYESLTVSENSILAGISASLYESAVSGGATSVGWTPRVSTLC